MSATKPMTSSVLSADVEGARAGSPDHGGLPVPVLVIWAALFALTLFYVGQCYLPVTALHG